MEEKIDDDFLYQFEHIINNLINLIDGKVDDDYEIQSEFLEGFDTYGMDVNIQTNSIVMDKGIARMFDELLSEYFPGKYLIIVKSRPQHIQYGVFDDNTQIVIILHVDTNNENIFAFRGDNTSELHQIFLKLI